MRHQEMNSFATGSAAHPPFSQFRGLVRNPIVLSGLLLFAAWCGVTRADDLIRAVRVSNVVGTVQILNGTETQFSQAYPNMPLMQGSTLKTGEDGRAEIQFEDGSVARLTPNSSLALPVLGRNSQGNFKTEVDLLTGLAYVEMSGTANQWFAVNFGGNEVISPAPAKFRVNLDANPVEFAVLDGTAHLSNGTAFSVDVRANETVRFDTNDSARYFLAEGVDGDSWDQWNADRDQAMSQMAAQQTREARGSANPNDPGWSDLDYYGNWYQGAGGGSVWAPNGVGAGWDPYGSGYWGNYGSSGGYVWISGYPWGWLPYHCGNWNYYNSFGWGWSPGLGCGNNWYPVNSVGYAPPNYHRLPRPTLTPVPPGRSPVRPLRGNHALIAVDRGPEATEIAPKSQPVPRTVALNGTPARLMPRTPSPVNSFGSISSTLRTAGVARPVATPGEGRSGYGFAAGGQPQGNMPVYRPVAPSAGYRPSAPVSSFSSHPSGGAPSAPSFSGSSVSSSHVSAPAPAASAGGHPK